MNEMGVAWMKNMRLNMGKIMALELCCRRSRSDENHWKEGMFGGGNQRRLRRSDEEKKRGEKIVCCTMMLRTNSEEDDGEFLAAPPNSKPVAALSIQSSINYGSSDTNYPPISIDSRLCSHHDPHKHHHTCLNRWNQRAGDALWIASAIFILYFGDFRTNFVSILSNDPRICRVALHIGSICILVVFFLLFNLAISLQKNQEKMDVLVITAIQIPMIIGLLAFILFSIALWPIWSVLTLPLLFTLFMTVVVILPYVLPYMDVKIDLESLCATPLYETLS